MPAIISIGEPLPEEIWQAMVKDHIPPEHPVAGFIHDLIETGILPRDKSGLILEVPSTCKTLEEIVVAANLFPSLNQARKNGFFGLIEEGISKRGTKANRLWIWKRPEPKEVT